MTQNIINMTPHPVTVLDSIDGVVKVFPKGESTIRLSVNTVPAEAIAGIATSTTVFGEPVGLPEYVEGTYYIVSQLVKSALPQRNDLLVPAEVVRDANGVILGCRSLGR